MALTEGKVPKSRASGSLGESRSLITLAMSECELDSRQFFVNRPFFFLQTMRRLRSALN